MRRIIGFYPKIHTNHQQHGRAQSTGVSHPADGLCVSLSPTALTYHRGGAGFMGCRWRVAAPPCARVLASCCNLGSKHRDLKPLWDHSDHLSLTRRAGKLCGNVRQERRVTTPHPIRRVHTRTYVRHWIGSVQSTKPSGATGTFPPRRSPISVSPQPAMLRGATRPRRSRLGFSLAPQKTFGRPATAFCGFTLGPRAMAGFEAESLSAQRRRAHYGATVGGRHGRAAPRGDLARGGRATWGA